MPHLIITTLNKLEELMQTIFPGWLVALLARISIASVFWRSAQTKISGWELFGQHWKFWNVSESTFLLFEYEYSVPLLPVKLAAYMATFGEFFLSLAIITGLLTRFSAIGLLAMTAVIQVFVYPDAWNVHILWAALLVYLVKNGGGAASFDAWLKKSFEKFERVGT